MHGESENFYKVMQGNIGLLEPRNGRMLLTFVDVQHEAVEVDSLFATVLHMGVKQIHKHGLPCA